MKLTREEAKTIKQHARDATRLFACPSSGLPLLASEGDDEVQCDCGLGNPALAHEHQDNEVRDGMHYVRFLGLW